MATVSATMMHTSTKIATLPAPTEKPPAMIWNFEKNVFMGGTPAMASAATPKPTPEIGYFFTMPRSLGSIRVPSVKENEPAIRKNSVLAKAWLKMWHTAPSKASWLPKTERPRPKNT